MILISTFTKLKVEFPFSSACVVLPRLQLKVLVEDRVSVRRFFGHKVRDTPKTVPDFLKTSIWIQIASRYLSQNNETTKLELDSTTITLDKGWCGHYIVRISSAHLIVAAKKLINWHFHYPNVTNTTYSTECFLLVINWNHKNCTNRSREFPKISRIFEESYVFLKLIVHLRISDGHLVKLLRKGINIYSLWPLLPSEGDF